MIKITRFFYISLMIIPLIVLAIYTKTTTTLLTAYSVVVVHELFHLLTALYLNVRVKSVIIMPFGMTLRLFDRAIKEPGKEILIAFAGPLANVIMFIGAWLYIKITGIFNENIFLFCWLNIITLAINLMPVLPLDGGRVLRAIFTMNFGYIESCNIMRKITRVFCVIFSLFGFLILYLTRFNVSLVLIATFIAFNLINEERANNYLIMQELLYNKNKVRDKGIISSKILTVNENTPLRDIFKKIGLNSYTIVKVTNDEGEIIATLTETDIVSSIMDRGYNSAVYDMIQ